MRPLVVLIAVAVVLVVAAVVADGMLRDRIESQAADALRADLTARSGERPERVRVSLEGTLAGLRAIAGPSPDASATARGVAIPQTDGAITRLSISLAEVDIDAGDALGGDGEPIPFSAGSGSFTATIDEADLNGIVGAASPFERFEVEDDVILAVSPAQGGLGTPAEEQSFPFTAELGMDEQGDTLVLRPAGAAPTATLGGVLANATLTIRFVLPAAFELQGLRVGDGELVGSGTVRVNRLTTTGAPAQE